MDRKFQKKYFFPPQVPPLPTSRRNLPGKHFLPLEVLRRESPTLRIGSSSTSSKLWTLSSDTRDSQFDLTRAREYAGRRGRRKLTCDDKRAARSTDRNFLRRAFLPTKRCTLHLRYTESRSSSRHLVIYYSRGRNEFLVPADRDDCSPPLYIRKFMHIDTDSRASTKVQIISLCVLTL